MAILSNTLIKGTAGTVTLADGATLPVTSWEAIESRPIETKGRAAAHPEPSWPLGRPAWMKRLGIAR